MPRRGKSETYGWVAIAFIAILLGLEYFLIPVAGAWLLFRYGKIRFRSSILLTVPLLIASLSLSAMIGLGRDGAYDRLLSSIYSIGILLGGWWFGSGAIKYLRSKYFKTSDSPDFRFYLIDVLGNLAWRLVAFCVAMLAVGGTYYLITRNPGLSFPTLLVQFSNSTTEMLQYLSSTRIYRSDWGFGTFAVPRFIYFARWDTAGAIIVGLAGTVASLRFHLLGKQKLFWLCESLTALLILSTLSRTVIVLHLIFSLIMYLQVVKKRGILLAAYIVGATLLIGISSANDIFEEAASFRQYSTGDRFGLYQAALEQLGQQEPFFGLGYKPKDTDVLEYAIGSHSMILSYLVRGGLFAALFSILSFWIFPVLRFGRGLLSKDTFVRTVTPFLARGFAILGAWTLFQEIDTSMLSFTAIFLFLLLADILTRGPITRPSDEAGSKTQSRV